MMTTLKIVVYKEQEFYSSPMIKPTSEQISLPFRLRFIAATFASLQYLLRLLRSWLRLLQMTESAESPSP